MNSTTKSALRSTLQKESESLDARLPEPPVPVTPTPERAETAAVTPAPEAEAAPAVVLPPVEAPAEIGRASCRERV